jgi:hypothetical protein
MKKSYVGFLLVLTALVLPIPGAAPEARGGLVTLESPHGRVVVTLKAAKEPGGSAAPMLSVKFRGRELLQDSSLGIVLAEKGDLLAGAALTSTRRENHDETYQVITGKQNPVRNHYRQVELGFKSSGRLSQYRVREGVR